MIISCDRCNARLDLGPATVARNIPQRSPSGWIATGDNKHACALCAPGFTSSFIRRFG
jgi:hypothetical protein